MGTIVYHSGQLAGSLAQHAVLDDDNRDTSHGHILLRASVDGGIFRHIDGTAHYIRAHVSYQGNLYVEILTVLGSIDSVVGSNVQIVDIGRHLEILRIERIVSISRRGNLYDLAKVLSLFLGLLGPCTCIQISSLLNQEVGWDLHKL